MKKLIATAALLLVVATSIGVAAPAQALTPPTTRSAPPVGTGYLWGAPLASLARTSPDNCAVISNVGGWSKRVFYSAGTRFGTPTDVVVPGTFYLGEPCYNPLATGIGALSLGIRRYTMNFLTPPIPRAPNVEGGSFSGNPYGTVSSDIYLMCQSSEWATSATRVNSNGTSSIEHNQALPTGGIKDVPGTASSNAGHQIWGNASTSCPYLRSATIKLCVWAGAGNTGMACRSETWSAERWYANTKYGTKQGESGDPYIDQCRINPSHPDCIYIDPPKGSIDGTDYAAVCAGMASFTAPGWANFSDWVPSIVAWWNMAIGHYARCLFVPWNGWDRDGAVASAWESQVIGEILSPIGSLTAAFNVGATCGTLVPSTAAVPGLVVNTCEWYWAPPVRTVLGYGVLIGGGIWLIRLTISTILGTINKKTPDPVGGGES